MARPDEKVDWVEIFKMKLHPTSETFKTNRAHGMKYGKSEIIKNLTDGKNNG